MSHQRSASNEEGSWENELLRDTTVSDKTLGVEGLSWSMNNGSLIRHGTTLRGVFLMLPFDVCQPCGP